MALRIISADERAAETGGVKALILGPYGVGKTSLLRTLDAERTLFVDGEAGDLAVQDVPSDTIRPLTWPDCRDLAAFIGGAEVAARCACSTLPWAPSAETSVPPWACLRSSACRNFSLTSSGALSCLLMRTTSSRRRHGGSCAPSGHVVSGRRGT